MWGTVTARGFADFITDIVDVIPIGATGQAPGNLPRATRFGGQLTATLNFDRLGWAGAKLDLDATVQRSRLTDPLTGQQRPISEDPLRIMSLALRYDIPRTDWAVGANSDLFQQARGYRLDQRTQKRQSPASMQLFVENKDVYGLTVRGAVFGLTHVDEGFDREFYNGRRTGGLAFTERRDRHYGLIFDMAITGKF